MDSNDFEYMADEEFDARLERWCGQTRESELFAQQFYQRLRERFAEQFEQEEAEFGKLGACIHQLTQGF